MCYTIVSVYLANPRGIVREVVLEVLDSNHHVLRVDWLLQFLQQIAFGVQWILLRELLLPFADRHPCFGVVFLSLACEYFHRGIRSLQLVGEVHPVFPAQILLYCRVMRNTGQRNVLTQSVIPCEMVDHLSVYHDVGNRVPRCWCMPVNYQSQGIQSHKLSRVSLLYRFVRNSLHPKELGPLRKWG